MIPLQLVERSTTGLWRAVQDWQAGPIRRTRESYWKEPEATFRDAYGAFCWRTTRGSIVWSDPEGGEAGSVDGPDTLRHIGFAPAFGETIERDVAT